MVLKRKYFFSICLIVLLGGGKCHKSAESNAPSPSPSGEPLPFSGVPLSQHQQLPAGSSRNDSAPHSAKDEQPESEHIGHVSDSSDVSEEHTTETDTNSTGLLPSDPESPPHPRNLFDSPPPSPRVSATPSIEDIRREAAMGLAVVRAKAENLQEYNFIFEKGSFEEMIFAAQEIKSDDLKWAALAFLSAQAPQDPAWDVKRYIKKKSRMAEMAARMSDKVNPFSPAPQGETPVFSLREVLKIRLMSVNRANSHKNTNSEKSLIKAEKIKIKDRLGLWEENRPNT